MEMTETPDDYEDLHISAELCVKYGLFTSYDRKDRMTSLTSEYKNYIYVLSLDKVNIAELMFQSMVLEAYKRYSEVYKDKEFEDKDNLLFTLAIVVVHLISNEYIDEINGDNLIDMAVCVESFVEGLLSDE